MHSPRRYLICPDSMKGSLTARQAAEAMRKGVLDADPGASVTMMPLADGGEGTAAILGEAMHGVPVLTDTVDALCRPLSAGYYITPDGVAVIDVASTVGLGLLRRSELNIMLASSRGVGLMMLDALRRGIRRFIIGMGGSACCDGGRGMYEAVIDEISGREENIDITVLCDVNNPFYGPSGAACVFAPQKGATVAQVGILDRRLMRWCDELHRLTGRDVSQLPGAGAAGGIAGMLAAVAGASLQSGIRYVTDILGLDRAMHESDLVLTGEGRIDSQTLGGKTISGVADMARRSGVAVIAFGGSIETSTLLQESFSRLVTFTPQGMPLDDAMRPDIAAANLRRAVATALNS